MATAEKQDGGTGVGPQPGGGQGGGGQGAGGQGWHTHMVPSQYQPGGRPGGGGGHGCALLGGHGGGVGGVGGHQVLGVIT